MNSIPRLALALSTLIAASSGHVLARPFCSDPGRIVLPSDTGTRGGSVYEAHNNIDRGQLACFTLRAPAGKRLHVTVSSADKTAVFQLYPPGWTIAQKDGGFTFGGATEPGAGEGDDTRSWTGPYTTPGATLIVVGMTRGGGQYRLHVEVR